MLAVDLLIVACLGCILLLSVAQGQEGGSREIGSRLELMVDDWLIERMDGVRLELNHPVPREIALVFDKPWEGSTCCYVTVFRDNDLFRMYYRGSDYDIPTQKSTHPELACYAESRDGITWTRPNLGLFEFGGSKDNNIVWTGVGSHNFTPFKDANPDCAADAKYKGFVGGEGGLLPIKSPDGIHWELMQDTPVITLGDFDSQNLAFWDTERKCYVDYHRRGRNGVRDIMTCTSQDFINWTEPVYLDYGDTPPEHLYTNAITQYHRAPHFLVGFPKRFVPERVAVEHPYPGVSDGVFMSSRDGVNFKRWTQAFIRPGLQKERWVNRNNMTAWGILETAPAEEGLPPELSVYSSESYYMPGNRIRRFTLRLDGFVSARAGYPAGEMLTRPLLFAGNRLVLNYATSAAGSVKVEVQDPAGNAIPGFALADCEPLYGDEIAGAVKWTGGPDLGALAGQPVRLRFVMMDADVYSLQFQE